MNHATPPAIIMVHVPPALQRQLQAEAEVRAAAEQRAADAEQRAADAASNRQSASHRASQGPGGFFHAVHACAAIMATERLRDASRACVLHCAGQCCSDLKYVVEHQDEASTWLQVQPSRRDQTLAGMAAASLAIQVSISSGQGCKEWLAAAHPGTCCMGKHSAASVLRSQAAANSIHACPFSVGSCKLPSCE